jgi:hypothetical protein
MHNINKINHRLSYKTKSEKDAQGDPIYGKLVLTALDNDLLLFSSNYYNRAYINYQSYANKLDLEDYINHFDIDRDDPFLKKIQSFDLINTRINSLKQELMDRPLITNVIATNPDAYNMKLEYLNKLTLDHINNIISMINKKLSRKELEEYHTKQLKRISSSIKDYKLKGEIEANSILKYHILKDNLKYIFGEGFLDGLLAAIECYWVGVRNNNIVTERLNPLRLKFSLPPDVVDIKNASWATYEYYITYTEAIDWFNEFLNKEEDYKRIDNQVNSSMFNNSFNFSTDLTLKANYIFGNVSIPTEAPSADSFFGEHKIIQTILPTFSKSVNNGLIRVLYAEWESLKEQKIVYRYTDKYGEEKDIVEADYKLDKSRGDKKLETYWTKEIWQGYKVGDKYIDNDKCLYLDVKPKSVQHTSLRNPNKAYLGFVGKIYNTTNSEPTPIYNRAMPAQRMYNLLLAQIEKLLSSEIGRILIIDPKAIPDGLEFEEFMAIVKATKLAPIDTTNTAKPFGEAELSMAQNAISERLNLLAFYKNEVTEILGISRERIGQIQNGTNVSDNRANIQNSRTVTEGEFRQHNDLVRQVLNSVIDVSKQHYRDNPLQAVMLDADSPLFITTEEIALHDYDLIVANNSTEKDIIRTIDGLSQAMIQNQYPITAILKIMSEEYSLTKKIKMLEDLEQERQEIQQKQAEIQQKMQQEKLAHEEKMLLLKEQKELEVTERINQMKLEIGNMNKDLAIQQAEMKREYMQYDTDRRFEVKNKEVDVLAEKNDIAREKLNL